jgi:hypothetical protein
MALLDALQNADDGNFLRALAETVLQILMEADVEGKPYRVSRRPFRLGSYAATGMTSSWA